MSFQSQYNKPTPRKGQDYSTAVDICIPEPVIGIRERLAQSVEGMSSSPKTIQYFAPDDISSINKYYAPGQLDLTDIDKLKAQVNFMNEQVQSVIKKAEEQRQKEIADKIAAAAAAAVKQE